MFVQNIQLIEKALDQLLDMPVEQARIGCLVIGGLRCVRDAASALDACVPDDLPFANHFFKELASLPQNDGSHWLNLLEDLALLFRARRLGFPSDPVPEAERAVQDFFEQSGEWGPGTLVHEWYWKTLPERLSS